MSFIQAFAAAGPLAGLRRLRLAGMASSAAAVVARIAARLGWREGHLIGLAGALIVLFIAAFASLMVRQIDQASRTSNQEHVEQLLKAVNYQLDTMLVGIEQSMRNAEHEIRDFHSPQKLVELTAGGRVSLHLLSDFIFIDRHGRVVVSSLRASEISSMLDRSDQEYFRAELETHRTGSRIGRPMQGRRTGVKLIPVSHAVRDSDGRLMGVLVAMIDIEALKRIWVDIGLRPDDRIDLIGEDGKAWFSWAQSAVAEHAAGQSMSWSQSIPGWPMRAVATLDQATIDRHSFGAKRDIVVSAAAGAILVGLFCLALANRVAASEAVKARLLAMIDAVPVEFHETDRERRLILANRATRLSQRWIGDPIGKTRRELFEESRLQFRGQYPDQDWDGWLAKRAIDVERPGTFERTRPNGECGRFFVTDMPGGGQVVVRVDITESKRREAELAATQDRYRMLFEAIPYPMIVVAPETRRFLAVNDAAVEQYGWSREEALTMTSNDLYPPEDLPAVIAMREKDVAHAARTVPGLRHRKKGGAIIDVDTSVRPTEFDGRPALMVIVQDITERVRAEQARRSAEAKLRQSQKMEALGQLTGGVAHDFNNILTVILANADALQEEENLDAGVVGRLDQIGQAVQRAADLTRRLLAFSRKQTLSPKRTDINNLVAGTGQLLRRTLGEHIEIKPVLADGLWATNVDQAELESALVNLCVNARDAMPGGGTLLIETSNVTLDDDYVARNPDAATGDYAMLAITDSGSGIPPEVLAKVFEPFFTTKGVGKGTGLGLSMVYGFVKQSDGHIKIASEVGRGTSFKLYLPRHDGPPEETAVRQAHLLPGGTERILVVEDDGQVRSNVVQQLQGLGYAVLQAPDGTAGIASFEAAARPYDLLLTDVMMPGPLNGKGLADEVARRWPATRIVFMSGYAENAIVHDGRLDDGVLLLSKPFRRGDLAQIVRQALDGADRSTGVVPKAA